MTQTIIIENQSKLVAQADLDRYVSALMVQLNEHIQPFWQPVDSSIGYFSLQYGTAFNSGQWGLIIQDGLDIKSDLGYHDDKGFPCARVDAQGAQSDGTAISDLMSHELNEMACDPYVQRLISGPWGKALCEVSDPFLMPQQSYDINGVRMANFTTPEYWGLGKSGRLDMKGILQPGQAFPYMPDGGYSMILPPDGGPWKLTFAPMIDPTPHELAKCRRYIFNHMRYAVLTTPGR
jgi:hypothetical protein